MEDPLRFDIQPQPDLTTCGPTCLHALYRYYAGTQSLDQVIQETRQLQEGGTMAVFLGTHALRQGYSATLFTYDLSMFDPTWFSQAGVDLPGKLRDQLKYKRDEKFHLASRAFLAFISLGGKIRMEDLTGQLLRRYLKRRVPVLVGLSATWLYAEQREIGPTMTPDDVRGEPQGHFVVLCGYDHEKREVLVADPLMPNPLADHHIYSMPLVHVVSSIMLGVLTYDANLLVIQPPAVLPTSRTHYENPDRH